LLQLLEAAKPAEFGMAGGVAWWAHIGGFVAGLIVMPLLAGLRPAVEQSDRFRLEEF
jgi:membrane associated rhomboid family serine protease